MSDELKEIANNIKDEEKMDFTDIDNYDLGEETEDEEKEDEIDVISKKYNPYTIII